MSVRQPASWRSDQAEQEGVWYRYFLAPPSGPQNRAPVTVTLLAGAMAVTVDEYAQTYLAGHTVASTKAEERQGVPGQSWVFSSADGATRYRLLLLAPGAAWSASSPRATRWRSRSRRRSWTRCGRASPSSGPTATR